MWYIRKHVQKFLENINRSSPVLHIFDGDCSLLSKKLIASAKKNNVSIFTYSHILCPLVVSCFSILLAKCESEAY